VVKQYELSFGRRTINRLMRVLATLGIGPKVTYKLTVAGRKSGKRRTTPVNVVELDGSRWLVSPYGEREWVKNARVAGTVTLKRRSTFETMALEEADATTAAPVLQKYVADTPVTRPYFEVTEDSPLDAFIAEAPRHPVFRMTPSAD
jgi:deazaflavin-dependent oxidoreductase (nitroreductase family)